MIQLIVGIFSFQPENMRNFNLRRCLIVSAVLPLFVVLLIVNQLFLALDHVIFYKFHQQKIKKPIFIISAPRSATTFLFHLLAEKENYTSFKLWEIIFAPSICQKYILGSILNVDRKLGGYLRKFVLRVEDLLIGKLKKIHLIGLNFPEEDEAVLLWSLSTFYLHFFYPNSTCFDEYVLFDKSMPEKKRKRIMKRYTGYVKRHNFVYNRCNEKQYLSKNPLMMCKIKSLSEEFSDALILNINRSPAKTLPSTLELNRNLYGLFTSISVPEKMNEDSLRTLIEWYKMAEINLRTYFENRFIKIGFKNLIQQDSKERSKIEVFLELPVGALTFKEPKQQQMHKNQNRYTSLSKKELQDVLEEIPFMTEYCDEYN